jgi:hypothetical protein
VLYREHQQGIHELPALFPAVQFGFAECALGLQGLRHRLNGEADVDIKGAVIDLQIGDPQRSQQRFDLITGVLRQYRGQETADGLQLRFQIHRKTAENRAHAGLCQCLQAAIADRRARPVHKPHTVGLKPQYCALAANLRVATDADTTAPVGHRSAGAGTADADLRLYVCLKLQTRISGREYGFAQQDFAAATGVVEQLTAFVAAGEHLRAE